MTRAEKIARDSLPGGWVRKVAGKKRKPRNRRMIVKVQLSIYPAELYQQVYIYNRDRTVSWMGNASRPTMRFMGGYSKRYAYAHLAKAGKISLDGYAPEQCW
jgi:hypothetical protein